VQLEATTRWHARHAWAWGLLLFGLEIMQSVALLPLLLRWMPAEEVALWTSLTAGLGLINAVAAAYSQPLVRTVASRPATCRLPPNWKVLARRADRSGFWILVGAQLALGSWLAAAGVLPGAQGWLALGAYFVSMHVRLAAINRFAWTNGLRQLGRDKRLLVQASALALVLAVVLGSTLGSALGPALAALAASAWLLRQSVHACSTLGHNPSGAPAPWPDRREVSGLLLLNLAGYLNLGTDVLLANHLLPPEQAVSYAFWSRALMSFALLAGLYAQIRFPSWATAPGWQLRTELRRGLLALLALPLVAAAAYHAVSEMPALAHLCLLPAWMLYALACTAALGCGTLLAGQISTSRGARAFLIPSAALASCAPLMSWAVAQTEAGAQAFVLGYGLVNLGLLGLNLWFAARATSAPSRAAPNEAVP